MSQVPAQAKAEVAQLCRSLEAAEPGRNLWIIGGPGRGKSVLSAYLAQKLVPKGIAVVERLGDLLAELRWAAASGGPRGFEERLLLLIDVPLLVIDDFDQPTRSRYPESLTFEASCTRHDLLTLARLLRERRDALRPCVVATTSPVSAWTDRVTAVRRLDLVRGLLATVGGHADPIEDFPSYTAGVLGDAILDLQDSAVICDLDRPAALSHAA